MEQLKRVAGVEPLATSSLPGDPPAHDLLGGGTEQRQGGTQRPPSAERHRPPPPDSPADAFGKHFLRCFFCHIGDRYIEDHFCEEGRELMVAMLDELHDREFA